MKERTNEQTKWRMTFRHLCLFKIIRPLVTVVIVSLGEFAVLLFTTPQNNLLVRYTLCLNYFISPSF
jgi:hypothetical protein